MTKRGAGGGEIEGCFVVKTVGLNDKMRRGRSGIFRDKLNFADSRKLIKRSRSLHFYLDEF